MISSGTNKNHVRKEKAQLEDNPHSKHSTHKSISNATRASDIGYGTKPKATNNRNTKSSPPPTKHHHHNNKLTTT